MCVFRTYSGAHRPLCGGVHAGRSDAVLFAEHARSCAATNRDAAAGTGSHEGWASTSFFEHAGKEKEDKSMGNPTTGSGRRAPRIRRSRSGWTWTVRLALAVLACTFAGAGQAQPVYRGGLNEAVRELARTLVNEAELRDRRVLVKSEDFFELETELRLELSQVLSRMSISELTRSGVPVSMAGSDEDAVRVLHGRWRRESDTLLYIELFVAAPVESGDPTALRSARGRVPIDENIRKAIESTLEDWGRLLMLRLERGVRDQHERRVLLQPVEIGDDVAQDDGLRQFLKNWLRAAFVGSRLFRLITPPPGKSPETDGTLYAEAIVHLRYVEVSLSVIDNQTFEQVTFAKVKLDNGLFPPVTKRRTMGRERGAYQGFMVPKSLGISSAKELDGASVCIQTGTTTELNLADYFHSNGMKYEAVTIETNNEARQNYLAGRCDVYTTDISSLKAARDTFTDPYHHVILPEHICCIPQ